MPKDFYDDSHKGIIDAILNASGGTGGGTGGLEYSIVTSSTVAEPFKGYAVNGGLLVTLTLPSSPALGDRIGFYALSATGFRVLTTSPTRLRFGNLLTAPGSYVQSTEIGDSLRIVYLGNSPGYPLWGVTASQGSLIIDT